MCCLHKCGWLTHKKGDKKLFSKNRDSFNRHLDVRGAVAHLLAREQDLQDGEEDPAGHRSGQAAHLQDLELLDDVVEKRESPFGDLVE
jgi:hypothetical protein